MSVDEIPVVEKDGWAIEVVPVGYVRSGYLVVLNRGQGPQAFQVENAIFKSVRQDDGTYRNTHTFVLTPMSRETGNPESGDPWEVTYQAGEGILVTYRTGRRPIGLPPRAQAGESA
jgi:hypothetical protein